MRRRVVVALLLAAAGPAAAQSRPPLTAGGLDSLRQDVAIDSVDAEAYYRLGLGLWRSRRLDEADAAFRRALVLQPWHAGAHFARAVLLGARGESYFKDVEHRAGRDSAIALVRAAIADENAAFTLEPRLDLAPLGLLKDEELVPEARGNLSRYHHDSHTALRDEDPSTQMRYALRLMADRRSDSAYVILKGLVARTTSIFMRGDLMEWFAMAALRTGHPDEAAYYYRLLAVRAAHEEHDASTFGFAGGFGQMKGRYLLLYGVAEAELQRTDTAKAAFQQALMADLSLYVAHTRLADLAESEGDYSTAATERRTAIDGAPEQPRPYLDLGITLLQAGHPAEARDALQEAAEKLPWDPGIELFLFQAALASHDRPTAQRALDALDRYAPRRNHDQVVDAHHRFDEAPPP